MNNSSSNTTTTEWEPEPIRSSMNYGRQDWEYATNLVKDIYHVQENAKAGPYMPELSGYHRAHMFRHEETATGFNVSFVSNKISQEGLYFTVQGLKQVAGSDGWVEDSTSQTQQKLVEHGTKPQIQMTGGKDDPILLLYEDTWEVEANGNTNGSKIAIIQYDSFWGMMANESTDTLEIPKAFGAMDEGSPAWEVLQYDEVCQCLDKSYMSFTYEYRNSSDGINYAIARHINNRTIDEFNVTTGGSYVDKVMLKYENTHLEYNGRYKVEGGSRFRFNFGGREFYMHEISKNVTDPNGNL